LGRSTVCARLDPAWDDSAQGVDPSTVTPDEALTVLGQAIPPGSTAVIAEVEEPAVEVIDGEMTKLDGEVTRRPVSEVIGELAAAEDAADAAAREARHTILDASVYRPVASRMSGFERVGTTVTSMRRAPAAAPPLRKAGLACGNAGVGCQAHALPGASTKAQ
jgi:hypothetical protein